MTQDTSNMLLGAAILVVVVPAIYWLARTASRIGDRWSARMLEPLALRVGGAVHIDPPHFTAMHQGRKLRVTFSPETPVGAGEGAT